MLPKIYFKSIKGERPTNEDSHTLITNYDGTDKTIAPIDMFGVYDGHGGGFVSNFLSILAPKIFTDPRIEYPLSKGRVENICSNLQQILINKYNKKTKECGSTCLMVFRFKHIDPKDKTKGDDYLNIINIGDSRAVLCSGIKGYDLSKDHKPIDPEEKIRIQNLGGNVYDDGVDFRVDGLSLSRSFGDTTSRYTPPIPDLFKHKINKDDKFMILACDGLWDKVETQPAVNFVLHYCYDINGKRKKIDFNIANKLAQYSINQGSGDNVSVIIYFFD